MATQKLQLTQIGQVPIWSTRGEAAIFFKSKLAVDADGCPNAYAPRGSGLPALDDLGNGGRPGNWWALVTDNGEDNGTPIVQSRERGDPFPGFYISHTPLKDRRFGARDPRRYVDANTVNYIALPYHAFRRNLIATQRPAYGDVAAVVYHGRLAFAIYADARNDQDIGEGSIALARALRIPSSPVNGGTSARTVVHVVFARSGTGRPLPQAEIDRLGWDHFDRWGGFARLRTYFPEQIIPPLRVGS